MKETRLIILIFVISVFKVNAQYTKLFDFKDSIYGSYPTGNLINLGEYFYGMTSGGGINNFGVMFKIKSDGTGLIKLLDFDSTNGSYPQGSLIYDGTFLYGMTFLGGKYRLGTIFKIRPDGTGDSIIMNFIDSTGYEPNGSLFYDGTYLYGMTLYGGTNSDAGVIFKIMPNGRGYTKLHQFNYVDGYLPYGSLISDGTFLFRMTNVGGKNGPGIIFKIKKDGTSFTTLHDFNRLDGANPAGSLFYDGLYLYGMTNTGGSIGFYSGTIFKIKTDGTEFSSIFNMNYGEGSNPCGDLISDGTFLYGMTQTGGSISAQGTIFKILPDGSGFSVIYVFDGLNGGAPLSSLLIDGNFLYGMTSQGGSNNKGIFFKYQIHQNELVHNPLENGFIVTPNPNNGQFTINADRQHLITKMEAYNSFGNLINTSINSSGQPTLNIDITNNPKGIYVIKIYDEENNMSGKKVVIE